MAHDTFYKILGITPDVPLEKIKEAYHRAAKRNHPDLFPEESRHTQQLKMMKINEAYLTIIAETADVRDATPVTPGNTAVQEEKPENTSQVGPLKDPAYAYYKQGFKHYSDGQRKFYNRYLKEEQRIRYVFNWKYLLKLATESLQAFERSYGYFRKVVEEYPDSIWARDADLKIKRLQRFNAIYRKICNNISEQLGSESKKKK